MGEERLGGWVGRRGTADGKVSVAPRSCLSATPEGVHSAKPLARSASGAKAMEAKICFKHRDARV